jgi:tripartite-type tricarboxylate transporter receptor subunit TctC
MKRQLLVLVLAATMAGIASAATQTYPSRPIRLVVPYPPGGVMDATARPLAEKLKPLFGTVVVENIGGGGTEVGVASVSRAAPDGYTILLGNSSAMVINPLAGGRVSYDPIKNFDAVSIVGHVALALAVTPSLTVGTLKELVDYAKRNLGKLSYGTPGAGSMNHLTGERFKSLIGAPDIVHVPYRGAGPAIADVISGQIPMAIPAVTGQLLEFHRTGKLRVLAVTSPERLQGARDLPTVVEAGMPDLVVQATTWLLVPKGTPPGIIAQISQATGKALAEPDLQRIYLASGIEPSSDSSPAAATQLLQSEIVRWKPIVKQIGLKLD